MSIKRAVAEITTKPMNRREFLKNTGGALIALTGVATVLKSFGLDESDTKTKSQAGYGSSAYGDSPKRS